jgi:hypothetical protein
MLAKPTGIAASRIEATNAGRPSSTNAIFDDNPIIAADTIGGAKDTVIHNKAIA